MNKLNHYLILGLCVLLCCCSKDGEPGLEKTFEVEVVPSLRDCGLPVIDFKEEDAEVIQAITGKSGHVRYNAYNLSGEFDQVGLILLVKVRKIANNELGACTAYGPAYPWVAIVDAKLKE